MGNWASRTLKIVKNNSSLNSCPRSNNSVEIANATHMFVHLNHKAIFIKQKLIDSQMHEYWFRNVIG